MVGAELINKLAKLKINPHMLDGQVSPMTVPAPEWLKNWQEYFPDQGDEIARKLAEGYPSPIMPQDTEQEYIPDRGEEIAQEIAKGYPSPVTYDPKPEDLAIHSTSDVMKHPAQMTEEEFNIAESRGMGITWKNAIKLPDGTIIESSTREHGDMIPALEEEYDIDAKDMERGWTWKGFPKEQSYIGVPDVSNAKGSFYDAYNNKYGKSKPTGRIEDKLSKLKD